MNNLPAEDLVSLWKTRLEDARLRYDFARNYVEELQKRCIFKVEQPGERQVSLQELEKTETYQTALQGESLALAYYRYVLRVFTALTIDHKLPNEKDWPPPDAERQPAG